MRIALTGGIACGKSLVSRYLNEAGVETLDADDIVHELLPDPAERRRLAQEVFANPSARRALEARLHPIVRARIDAFLDERPKAGGERRMRMAVIPLLFETHWDEEYDIICCVASDKATQVERMVTARGYTREEAESRLAAQLPVAEKAEKSHYVIENNGSAEELKEKVERYLSWLKSLTCSQE